MSEDFYEELPGGPEDIYEDLPDSAYDDDALSSPPPLPSTPIPSISHQKPAHQANTPPPPARAPTTQLTYKNQTLPVNGRSPQKPIKSSTMKPGKAAPPPKQTGGGGIDLSEIMMKARQRTGSQSALVDLETKLHKKEETDGHIAPWANQLRKTPKVPPTKETEGDKGEQQAPWVKRKSPIERETEEEVPEFIRKAKQMHGSLEQEDGGGSSNSPPPPIPSKPQVPPPDDDSTPNHTPSGPPTSDESKPGWLRQRERQQYLARTVGTEENPVPTGSHGKPPPMAPKPHKPPPALAPKPATDSPTPAPKKPRPIPAPRHQNVPSPTHSATSQDSSPPPIPASVRDKAKVFSEAPTPAPKPSIPPKTNVSHPPQTMPLPPEEKPPPISPRVEKKSPAPPPVPTRDSSMSRKAHSEVTLSSNPPLPPERKTSQQPPPPSSRPPGPPQMVPTIPEEERPPPPTTRPPPPPNVPPPNIPPPGMPPPPFTPPPPSTPPPSSAIPPVLPNRNPPKSPAPLPPTINAPPPIPRGLATQAQATPPTGVVSHFRRRPLQSVDFFNPPKLPPRNTKPKRFPAPSPSADDEQEIYDDTVAVMETEQAQPEDDGPEELYEDVVRVADPSLPPSSSPTPQFAPSIPPKAAPPIPSGPPPKRPPPPPVQVTSGPSEMANYEVDPNLVQNGVPQDAPQDVYEELHPEDDISSSPPPSTAPSSSSLLPPSTSQGSLSPSHSPTLERKQKLSKEQKRLQKEEERKDKEKKRLEKEREKEKKKKDEIRMKNRAKGLKTYKEFKLPADVQSLFAVEVLTDQTKAKDHLMVTKGEVCFVLLINHPKLPDDKYFIEKEDGTMGYVKKDIVQRTAYQSPQSVLSEPAAATDEYPIPEDIYERLPQDELDEGDCTAPPPALPPLNTAGYPPPRFPAPAQPPPPPPDEPQDTYEYLPEEQGSF